MFVLISTTCISQTYEVLFLGNSYTGNNNLPDKVLQLAVSGGDSLIYDAYTPGGAQFMTHSTNTTSLNKIASDDWDFLVLQGQSQEVSWSDAQMATDVYPYAAVLNDSIKSNNECTETLFYMTWGRRYGDAMNCLGWPPVCTFEGMTARLRHGYLTLTADNEATVAPAGAAWRNSIEADSNLVLHAGDNSRPNTAGTYLTACVFYASIFRKSPVGLSYTAGLSPTDAAFLQNIAHITVIDSLETWSIGHGDIDAAFTHDTGSLLVNFMDSSTNATSYHWVIEDTTYSVQNPSHLFSGPGVFTVRLEASNNCDTVITQDYVVVGGADPTGVEQHATESAFNIYPNPARDIIYIEGLPEREVEIVNAFGKRVSITGKTMERQEVDIRSWPSGIYIFRCGLQTKRFVKQ